jgi:exonuclease SbcD
MTNSPAGSRWVIANATVDDLGSGEPVRRSPRPRTRPTISAAADSVRQTSYYSAMPSFRFVHAADLHLDTPFQGVAATPEVAEALRDASLQAWDDLVELTLREQAAFLLLAGDIYDGAMRGMRAQLRFLQGLEKLAQQHVPVLIVNGNHDPVDEGWPAIRSWPAGVRFFSSSTVESATIETEGGLLATVHGISFARRDVGDNLATRFPRPDAPGFHAALLHCNAGANLEHDPYSPCTVPELATSGHHYWALGHIHKRQFLAEGPTWIAYPGNLQGRSPKPAETGAKGALVVDVLDDRVHAVRFEACDRIRFVHVALDVADAADVGELRSELLAEADRQLAQNDGRSVLVRARLTGRGPIHADLRPADALPALLDDLRLECAGGSPFVWWESLRDQTRAELDRGAIRARGDLSAELLQAAERLRADPASLREFAAKLLEPLPPNRLPEPLRGISDDDLLDLLGAAEELALDLRERD